jgi:hypothetical protein
MSVRHVNDLMGLLPKSAVMVSHRPPLWRSMRERRIHRAVAAVMFEAGHRVAVTGHVTVAGDLITHRAAQGGVV